MLLVPGAARPRFVSPNYAGRLSSRTALPLYGPTYDVLIRCLPLLLCQTLRLAV